MEGEEGRKRFVTDSSGFCLSHSFRSPPEGGANRQRHATPHHAPYAGRHLFQARDTHLRDLRAVVRVAAEEHGLPPVIAEAVALQPGNVATLGVARANARLEILRAKGGGRSGKGFKRVERSLGRMEGKRTVDDDLKNKNK